MADKTAKILSEFFKREEVDHVKNFLEVGPKHGRHTRHFDKLLKPESITCIDLPHKKSHKIGQGIRAQCEDFNHYWTEDKYSCVFLCGVIYHNLDPIGMLRRCWSLAEDDAYLCFESATTRNSKLKDQCVIELLPNGPNNEPGCPPKMFPSKDGCLELLRLTGWEVLHTTHLEGKHKMGDRIAALAKKVVPVETYLGEVDNILD